MQQCLLIAVGSQFQRSVELMGQQSACAKCQQNYEIGPVMQSVRPHLSPIITFKVQKNKAWGTCQCEHPFN